MVLNRKQANIELREANEIPEKQFDMYERTMSNLTRVDQCEPMAEDWFELERLQCGRRKLTVNERIRSPELDRRERLLRPLQKDSI